jgi:signal transduction histidine kinase
MTLKARLAGMMTLVLLAVVAVQFVLAEHERRELVSRLEKMSGDLDRSTATFVQRAHALAARPSPGELEAFLAGFTPESLQATAGKGTSIHVMVVADSSRAPRLPVPWEGRLTSESIVERRLPGSEKPGTKRTEQIFWMRKGGVLAVVDSVCIDSLGRATVDRIERQFVRRLPAPSDSGTNSTRDFVINLPLPLQSSDSLYSVQVRYSYASLAEELSRSRRRSLVWLVALLGAGIVAAIGVAGQFTRPIRALETSFGRVVEGDLDVRVRPERPDEIGHLTNSFNTMVARLRDSQQMAERLAESEHLASLGRLAAGVAHEIRNPLNAILLNLQQMQDRVRLAALPEARRSGAEIVHEVDKYHTRMTNELARLEHLVGSFLDLAKSGELRFETIDAAAGVRGAVELFRPVAADRGIALAADLAEDVTVEADASRLATVWNNLIANALQATPQGGQVTVRAVRDGDALEVVVQDTGPGIPAAALPHIWEPFYSGREGGTGLGLSIVRSTVEHHGGTIVAESPAGGGTRMHVRLPLRRPATASEDA